MPDYLDRESYVGLNFEDAIFKKCRGYYKRVKKHMTETEPGAPMWMLSSPVSVEAAGMECDSWVVHFFHDGNVFLWETPPKKLTGPDSACIRALAIALMAAGWNRLEPSLHEIDANPLFWKKLWETGIVDSKQLTQQYGKRKTFGE